MPNIRLMAGDELDTQFKVSRRTHDARDVETTEVI